MSIYRPRTKSGHLKSPYYHFDFVIKVAGERRRVHGSTNEKTKAKAREAERREKDRLKSERPNDSMTIASACLRYHDEVAASQPSADDTAKALEHCTRLIGGSRKLVNITADDIAQAALRRAGETYGKKTKRAVSSATVNRQIIEPLRRVFRRARAVWGVSVDPASIPWRTILRPEPRERVRELTADEGRRFWLAIRPDYIPFFWFLANRGFRVRAQIGMKKSDVDLERRVVRVWQKGEGRAWKPITAEQAGVLATEMHRTRGEHVWTFERQKGGRRGLRSPITYDGMRRVIRNALTTAEIPDFRTHDLRHDFATKLLRATQNLALVRTSLGHKDITSTARYAHVLDDDVTRGMEVMSSAKSMKIVPAYRNGTGTNDD